LANAGKLWFKRPTTRQQSSRRGITTPSTTGSARYPRTTRRRPLAGRHLVEFASMSSLADPRA